MNKKLFWIYLLSSSIYFTQGIEGLPGISLFFYLKETLGFTPSKIMYIGSIAGLAWLIKPLWGYLCDNFLSNKKWIILSLLGSITIAGYFGIITIIPLVSLIFLLFLSGFNAALRDVSVDGIMCIEGKEGNVCDKIQAVQWVSITIAAIFVGLAGGYIADNFSYKIAYLWLIPVYLVITGVVLRYKTSVPRNRTTVPLLSTLCSYKELFLNKKFLFACLFLFLYKFSPSFGTPLSFIQRDVFRWSGQWMGILGAIVSCFEILGAIVFFKLCKKINVRKWLYISVFLGAITSLCYLYFTPTTAVIYGILFSVLGMFVHLIVLSLMAKWTITGKEATSFALLCSISNLSGTASSLSGAFLFPKIGLQLLIVASSLTSFICLPLIKHIFKDYKDENM